ncbi:hypothetical protein GQ457_15G020140 [Hibiscus cannabinus]
MFVAAVLPHRHRFGDPLWPPSQPNGSAQPPLSISQLKLRPSKREFMEGWGNEGLVKDCVVMLGEREGAEGELVNGCASGGGCSMEVPRFKPRGG